MLEFHNGIPDDRLIFFIILPSGAPRQLKQMALEFLNSMVKIPNKHCLELYLAYSCVSLGEFPRLAQKEESNVGIPYRNSK